MLLCPLPDSIEISALVPSIEIDIGSGRLWIPPDLPQYADVDGAHELLPDNIQAMS